MKMLTDFFFFYILSWQLSTLPHPILITIMHPDVLMMRLSVILIILNNGLHYILHYTVIQWWCESSSPVKMIFIIKNRHEYFVIAGWNMSRSCSWQVLWDSSLQNAQSSHFQLTQEVILTSPPTQDYSPHNRKASRRSHL